LIMKTAVLIVNYNGAGFLKECLESLLSQSMAPDRIVMVDNGSTDGSADLVREKFSAVVVLRQEKNLGFAGGNNLGITWIMENLKPGFIALVNNDTQAEPQWLEALVEAMESDSGLGSASSCMLCASDAQRINDAGDMPLWDGTGLARGRHQEVEKFGHDEEVFGACAGAAIYRRQALEEAVMGKNYFDPDYFAYNEDVDLSWRLRKKGWRCRYVAGARILHHHAGTSGRFSTWVLYHGERNRCWTLLKNFSWWLILVSPFYTLLRFFFIFAGLKRETTGAVPYTAAGYLGRVSLLLIGWTVIRAWAAAVGGAPAMLVKRWKYGLGFSLSSQLAVLRKFGAKLEQTSSH